MVTKAADVTMATASSVQREPSMEEILASIRRIIEDSDPSRKQPEEAAEPGQDLHPAPTETAEAEVATFRAELRALPDTVKPFTLAEVQAKIAAESLPEGGREATATEGAPASPRSPISLAEIGAQVAAAPDDAGDQDAAKPDLAPDAAGSAATDWRDAVSAPQTATVSPAPQLRQEPYFDVQPRIEILEEELAEIPPQDQAVPDTEAGPEQADTAPAARLTLVSEHTGRQVAAAFGELSEAFAARSKKTFDEMAEEMLRPMLQDWLDNNLPTLVERLVREEIERVARGA